jgi:hypothetical protein
VNLPSAPEFFFVPHLQQKLLRARPVYHTPLTPGVSPHKTAAIWQRHLILRGTLKASEMPRMVLVSQPGGRFTDCKR